MQTNRPRHVLPPSHRERACDVSIAMRHPEQCPQRPHTAAVSAAGRLPRPSRVPRPRRVGRAAAVEPGRASVRAQGQVVGELDDLLGRAGIMLQAVVRRCAAPTAWVQLERQGRDLAQAKTPERRRRRREPRRRRRHQAVEGRQTRQHTSRYVRTRIRVTAASVSPAIPQRCLLGHGASVSWHQFWATAQAP